MRARRVAALALALGLAACAAPKDDKLAELTATLPEAASLRAAAAPALADDAIVAADGTRLPLRRWLPEGKAQAVVLALHGFNDYSHAFDEPGRAFARAGIATYAYDQRGFGEAPWRGHWVGRRHLAEDLATASALLRAAHPGVPLYLLGESMGGAVVITAVTGEAGAPRPDADGIILVAPAVWGRETMNVFQRAALWAGVRMFPETVLTGQGLRIVASDNIEALRALGRDPLVIKGARLDTINGLVDLMDAALAVTPNLNVPTLVLYGEKDQVVPKRPTQEMIARLPQLLRNQRVAWYKNGYHLLLRDLQAGIVLGDIVSWVGDRAAPLPSGADQYAFDVLLARR